MSDLKSFPNMTTRPSFGDRNSDGFIYARFEENYSYHGENLELSVALLIFKNSMTLISVCDSGRISGSKASSGKSQSWERKNMAQLRKRYAISGEEIHDKVALEQKNDLSNSISSVCRV